MAGAKSLLNTIKIVLLFITIVLVFSIIGCMNVNRVMVEDIDLQKVKDGQYEGEYTMGLVKAVVLVKVQDHFIKDIKIVKHRNGKGAKAEIITVEVIKKQSLKVDAVTGATASSNVILKAIEDALKKG